MGSRARRARRPRLLARACRSKAGRKALQLRTRASGTRSSSSLLWFADVRGVCPSPFAARDMLRHNSSAREKTLGAAQNALLQASAALVSDVVEVVIFRCF